MNCKFLDSELYKIDNVTGISDCHKYSDRY